MKNLSKVLVIMSTYNGEKYLKEQIESILNQKDISLTLYISDDCSTDSTVEIIKEFQKNHKNIILHQNEKNKNFTYNFLDSLFEFKECNDYDYYAFSDQDDVWLPEKLIEAIKKIEKVGKCTLYSSNLKLVDKDLVYNNVNVKNVDYKLQHYDVLCRNIVTGCTIVMDKIFKDFATLHYPKQIYLHDYWLAILANYGKNTHYIYDTCPDYILYRQHGGNLIGCKKSNKIVGRIKLVFEKIDKIKRTSNLFKNFYSLYNDRINENDKKIIEKIVNIEKFSNRIYLFFRVKSNNSKHFKLKILLNKY